MKRYLDCLIVRQPYASLIAYGLKRWEFRTYDCRKRGVICIGSSRGPPLKTGSSQLNAMSISFPRGFALATAVLVDSFLLTGKELRAALKGEESVTIHGHTVRTASSPVGEPLKDVRCAIREKNWNMFAWVLGDVAPLKNVIPLTRNGHGSTWTKTELAENEPLSKSLLSYL
jgi:hypothetical protein